MFNGLRAAYEPALEALAPLMAIEVEQTSAYRAVAEAVRTGNAKQARARAMRLLTPATTALISALDQLEEQP